MAKYVSIGQLQSEIRKSFASLKKYMDENVRAPVASLAAQAKALADEVVRRADEGEFNGRPGRDGTDAEVTAANIAAALGYAPASSDDYDPVNKTETMTQSVGRDADGRLWTAPGGGSGGGTWGSIAGYLPDQTDLAAALEAASYDDTALSGRVTAVESTVQSRVFSNPNLLDNGWFTVNQRGAAAIGDGYHVDRWCAYHASGSIGADGVTVLSGNIYQKLESALWSSLAGKTLTASALLSNGNIITRTIINFSGETTTFPGGEFRLGADYKTFEVYAHDTFRAIKLEIGAVSTLERDAMPDYTAELVKCQRYFWRVKTRNTTAAELWSGFCANATTARFTVFFPVQMRIMPTVTADAWGHLRIGTVIGTGTNLVLSDEAPPVTTAVFGEGASGANCIGLRLQVIIADAGFIGDTPCYIRQSTDSCIDFSADL